MKVKRWIIIVLGSLGAAAAIVPASAPASLPLGSASSVRVATVASQRAAGERLTATVVMREKSAAV
jgi:hypothetical protein